MSNKSSLSFLTSLAGWFGNPKDKKLAHKIISKAEEFIGAEKDIFNLHFFYPAKMKLFYKNRDNDSKSLQVSIDSALKQIKIAEKAATAFKKEYSDSPLPAHEGYSQLCIILEKQGKFDDAIKYAKQAKAQGWNDDWDNRIAKCQKKMEKAQQK